MTNNNTTPKRYRLKKDYESPLGKVHAGVIETTKEWQRRWFPNLTDEDFAIKDDWFEERIEVLVTKQKNYFCFLEVVTSQNVSESQFPLIKEAIERVLNGE